MVDVKRRYESPRRQAAARETRRAVLTAAAELFVEQGWAATTMAQIADRAGVTTPTVHAVGAKVELLAQARDLVMAGDDEPVAVADRATFLRALDAPTAGQAVDLLAAHITGVLSRYAGLEAVLHQASGTDPRCRELWERSEQERRRGAALAIDGLRGRWALALPRNRAVDVLWALMAGEPYRRLVGDRGWSAAAYTRWLAATLRAHLLA